MVVAMARKPKPQPPETLLSRLRDLCLALPHATEASSYGNPAFKVGGKPFAVLDHYQGGFCLWLLCAADQREAVLARPGWFASPYDPKALAVCGAVDQIDWEDARGLIGDSFRLAGGA
jgi:predicted DNA-binding protein (MmcQ/YjbR family)